MSSRTTQIPQADEHPIPKPWRTAVIRILQGDKRFIQSTKESTDDWHALFPFSFSHERHDAMANALRVDGIIGRRIHDMREPGEVYAFWFDHENKKLYGKINLTPDGRLIIIYSSHLPHKGTKKL